MCDHMKSTCEYVQVVGMNLAPVKAESCNILLQENTVACSTFPQLKCHSVLKGPISKVNLDLGNRYRLLNVEFWACEEHEQY